MTLSKIFSTILNGPGTTVKSMSLVSLVPCPIVSIMETVYHLETIQASVNDVNKSKFDVNYKLELLLFPLFWRNRFLIMV